MQEGAFKLSEADPCMLYKEDKKGVCIIIIYIDDMLIIGKDKAIDDAIKVLRGHFQLKEPTSLEDYLGVQIVQSDDGKKAWLGQPTIIKSLEKQFGERVAKKKIDTIYIKTQVFRLLRYYSPAPRNIDRSDWATQNITHNMTSSKT